MKKDLIYRILVFVILAGVLAVNFIPLTSCQDSQITSDWYWIYVAHNSRFLNPSHSQCKYVVNVGTASFCLTALPIISFDFIDYRNSTVERISCRKVPWMSINSELQLSTVDSLGFTLGHIGFISLVLYSITLVIGSFVGCCVRYTSCSKHSGTTDFTFVFFLLLFIAITMILFLIVTLPDLGTQEYVKNFNGCRVAEERKLIYGWTFWAIPSLLLLTTIVFVYITIGQCCRKKKYLREDMEQQLLTHQSHYVPYTSTISYHPTFKIDNQQSNIDSLANNLISDEGCGGDCFNYDSDAGCGEE